MFELYEPTFIVDGLQRVTSGVRVMADDEEPAIPHIGVEVYMGKDMAWERRRFEALNLDRTKLSPNVHLRNMKDESPAIKSLHRLTYNDTFPLRGRVQWNQSGKKSELITATSYVKTIGRLHSYYGNTKGSEVRAVAAGLDGVIDVIGRQAFIDNTKAFFALIDEAWGITQLETKEGATALKSTFLMAFATVLSEFENFWTDNDRLVVPANVVRKLSKIKVRDPHIAQLAGSSGAARDLLYDRFIREIEKGRSDKYLKRRPKSKVRVAPDQEAS